MLKRRLQDFRIFQSSSWRFFLFLFNTHVSRSGSNYNNTDSKCSPFTGSMSSWLQPADPERKREREKRERGSRSSYYFLPRLCYTRISPNVKDYRPVYAGSSKKPDFVTKPDGRIYVRMSRIECTVNSDESRNIPLSVGPPHPSISRSSRLPAHHPIVNDDEMRAAAESHGERMGEVERFTWAILHETWPRTIAKFESSDLKKIDTFLQIMRKWHNALTSNCVINRTEPFCFLN